MHHLSGDLEALLILGGVLVVSLCAVALVHLSRRARTSSATVIAEPASLVRILHDEEEIREAAQRAAEFEEEVSATLKERVERYLQLEELASVTPLDRRVVYDWQPDAQPHSA